MKYFIGKAGKNNSARFKKKVGEKNYYYTGQETSGYFLEDLMYSSLIEYQGTFETKEVELFISMPEEYIFMTLNDSELESGESSISYSKKDFKEEEIIKVLRAVVKNKDDLIFVDFDKDKEEFLFRENGEGFEFDKKISEIEFENMISRTQKSKIFLKRNMKVIILILSIISVPILSIKLSDKYITIPAEKDFELLKIKEKTLKLDKFNLTKKLNNVHEKTIAIQEAVDLFEDPEKMKKMLQIKL